MLNNMIKTMTLGVLSVGLFACAEATSSSPCGDGESVAVNGASYCVYKEAIVIVGGFDCPASMRFRMDFDNATVCGDHAFDDIDVPNDICARVFVPCTEESVDVTDGGGFDASVVCGANTCRPPHASTRCVAGRCEISRCEEGFADCDGNPDDGCETSLNTPASCGACDSACTDGCCTDGVCGSCTGAPPVNQCMAATNDAVYPFCKWEPTGDAYAKYCPPAGGGEHGYLTWHTDGDGGEYCTPGAACNTCLCYISCRDGDSSKCPQARTGDATPQCLGPSGGGRTCFLGCANGEECPTGMACVLMPEFGTQVCAWVSVAECPAACVPSTEVCDRQDNDCDALIDEDCVSYVGDGGVCPITFADCDADPANGCETSLNTPDNCGTCGSVCVGPSASCENGTCVIGL